MLLQKFMMVNQILNHNCVNMAGVHDKGPAHSRVTVNPEDCSDLVLGMLVLCVAEQEE